MMIYCNAWNENLPPAAKPGLPDQESDALQVGILKGRGVFQAEAQGAVHSNVREPDERIGNARRPSQNEGQCQQEYWSGESVHKVVNRGAPFCILQVAEHEQVRRENQQREQPPAVVTGGIKIQG